MKIIFAGGTGFLGKELVQFFDHQQNELIVLTRGGNRKEGNVQYIQWDGKTKGSWIDCFNGTDVFINLTGKSVDCRYTEENKNLIMNSRINSTRILQEVVEKMDKKPTIWMNASTATIYRHSLDKQMTESNGEYGNDFSMTVAKTWEDAFFETEIPGVRKVALRTSLVIGKSGGVYPVLKRLAKFGLAGKMGSGKQKFAWIHIDDVLAIVEFIIQNKTISGPVNCTSTTSPTNAEFLKALRKTLNVPVGIPQPTFLLKLGAIVIGTESELILKSRYVFPEKLIDAGFQFKFEDCREALDDLF